IRDFHVTGVQTCALPIFAAEAKKAREAAAAELKAKADETAELRQALEANNLKLAEAQQAQAELMRKQRALDEEKRELDLTIEKRSEERRVGKGWRSR